MLIGIDLRFLNSNSYSKFVLILVTKLIESNKKNDYNIYVNSLFIENNNELTKISQNKDISIKENNIKNFSLKEQTSFLKTLKKDNNNLMIFFNQYKPIFYKGEYYIFISSLKEIYYQNFDSSFKKYKYIFLLEKNLKKSKKIICFDENTKSELIERFNLEEEKIFLNNGFFSPSNINEKDKVNFEEREGDLGQEQLKIDIGAKYGIQKNYVIYSGGNGIEKNVDKLIWVFSKLTNNFELVVFGENISKNISLRNMIIEYSLQNKIKFLTGLNEKEKFLLYKQSAGVIFPSLYETFPFHLGEPLNYNIPIIASNIKSIKNIFGENIKYFSPISKSNMLENISKFLDKKDSDTSRINYENIKEKFSSQNSVNTLIDIIK